MNLALKSFIESIGIRSDLKKETTSEPNYPSLNIYPTFS